MRAKYKLPTYGNLNRAAIVLQGAQIGVDLFLPDGTVATLQSLASALQTYLTSSSSSSSGGVGGLAVTLWQLIQDIPPNVVAVAALNTAGLVTRKVDGTWVTRTLTGTARIEVTNGGGDAASPVVDMAEFAALSVLGVTGTSSARPAAITGVDGQVLRVVPPGDAAVLTYEDYKINTGGFTDTTTWSAVNLGPAASDRKLIMVVYGVQNGAASFTPTIDVGATPATLAVVQVGTTDSGGNRAWSGVFYVDLAAGTSANITLTATGATFFDSAIEVYNATGLVAGGPTDFASAAGGTLSGTVSLPVDVVPTSVCVAGILSYTRDPPPSASWTNATLDHNASFYGTEFRSVASASGAVTGTLTIQVASATALGAGNQSYAAVAVSFAPASASAVLFDYLQLEDLSDVLYLSGTPVDGQVLTYDVYLGMWVPETPAPSGGGGGFPPQIGYAGGI